MFGEKQTLHSNIRTSSQPWSTVVAVSWFGAALLARDQDCYAIIDGTMNSGLYQQILQENIRVSVCELKLNRRLVMQQDNNPKHTSKSTKKWLKKKCNVLEWPSQSPDLNPIEMLWKDLKRSVHARKPTNIHELKQFCKEEWAKIPPSRWDWWTVTENVWLRLLLLTRSHQVLTARVHILFLTRHLMLLECFAQ